MSKQLTIEPLGEHDENWLAVWAALLAKRKAFLAKEVLGLQVRKHKLSIQSLLEEAATFRRMNPDELFSLILANPRHLEESPEHGNHNQDD